MKRAIIVILVILILGVIMSLFDIDKNGSNRITPAPNSNDQVADRLAHGTTQNQNSGEEARADGLKLKERQVLAVQDGFNKAVFGFYGESNKFGFKVAEDGVDVLTATDDQLLFNSEQNIFKIVASGTVNLGIVYTGTTVAAGTQTYTLTHNLGYKPAILAYASLPDGTSLAQNLIQLPYVTFFQGGALLGEFMSSTYADAATDDTIVFKVIHHVGTDYAPLVPTWTVRYYLLQETAN